MHDHDSRVKTEMGTDPLPDLDLALEAIEPWWVICRERKGWKYDWQYGEAFLLLDRAMNDIIDAEKLLKQVAEEVS